MLRELEWYRRYLVNRQDTASLYANISIGKRTHLSLIRYGDNDMQFRDVVNIDSRSKKKIRFTWGVHLFRARVYIPCLCTTGGGLMANLNKYDINFPPLPHSHLPITSIWPMSTPCNRSSGCGHSNQEEERKIADTSH